MLRHPPGILFVPLLHPRTVVTVHDLGYIHAPEGHPAGQRRMLDLSTRWSVRAARHVIAISETTKRDLQDVYQVPADKIRVIPHGVDPIFSAATPESAIRIQQRLGIEDPYILTVGTVQPRKNFPRLAAAMRTIEAAGFPHRLLIVGRPGWMAEQVTREIDATGMRHRVSMLGYVERGDLPSLYAGADVVCLPSLYEGFGLPTLEAMAAGAPVVVSNRGALPEVAAAAAIVVDARSADSIATGLLRLLSNPALRDQLVNRGRVHSSRFTWDRAAKATVDLLRAVRDQPDNDESPAVM